MSNDEIRELIQLVVESGIAELEIERGEERVRIRSTLEAPQAAPGAAPSVPAAILETTPPAGPPANEYIQKSPIVGTYYEAPKPGDPPFVNVGDAVEIG